MVLEQIAGDLHVDITTINTDDEENCMNHIIRTHLKDSAPEINISKLLKKVKRRLPQS